LIPSAKRLFDINFVEEPYSICMDGNYRV
jgi:hypothetical protein